MSGPPNDVLVNSSGATNIHTLPSSNTAGVSDTVALPFQGVSNGVPAPVVLAAGIAPIGSVIGRSSSPSVTPLITAGAYTAGQEVGGLMTFPVGGAGSGILESIWITCKSIQTTALKLYIFNANPATTTWTNHSTPAISATDVPTVRGVFTLSAPDSGLGTHTIWNVEALGASFVGANLYGILVCVGTPTFVSTSDITVQLGIVDD